jgi:hypothetical protein
VEREQRQRDEQRRERERSESGKARSGGEVVDGKQDADPLEGDEDRPGTKRP